MKNYIEELSQIALTNKGLLTDNKEHFITTGEDLLNLKVMELPYLVEGLFPQTGLVALAGSSDTGKSSFLRQFAITVACGEEDFIGFNVNAKYRSVIYVSTEDDKQAMAYLLNKQMSGEVSPEKLKELRFIFNSEDILTKLDKSLKRHPADCVIIDTFTDLYGGDLNAANKVRSFLTDFHNLAQKHNCLIVFLHHTGKRTDFSPPSKDNLLGSQGFEAKMRLVIELRKDITDSRKRHLCIVKGNYIQEKDKKESYVLAFDEKMRYSKLDERVPFHLLVKPDPKKSDKTELKLRAIQLKGEGLSVTQITEKMAKEGHAIGRSTVGDWVKECPASGQP